MKTQTVNNSTTPSIYEEALGILKSVEDSDGELYALSLYQRDRLVVLIKQMEYDFHMRKEGGA